MTSQGPIERDVDVTGEEKKIKQLTIKKDFKSK